MRVKGFLPAAVKDSIAGAGKGMGEMVDKSGADDFESGQAWLHVGQRVKPVVDALATGFRGEILLDEKRLIRLLQ